MAKKKAKVVYIDGDDWNALYVNGEIVWQDHELSDIKGLELVKDVGPFTVERHEAESEWLDNQIQKTGEFPDSLDDVVTI